MFQSEAGNYSFHEAYFSDIHSVTTYIMYVNRADVFCLMLFSTIDRQILWNDMKSLLSFVFVGFETAKYKS